MANVLKTGGKTSSGNIITPEFRVSYPYVFKPNKPMQAGSEAKYSISMLFDNDADLALLKQAAKEAVAEKWGANPPKNLRSPFRDQGEKDGAGYVEGNIFITASSKTKPGLIDANNADIIDESDFYPGCYARATVRAYAYDQNGNRGVSFGLQNVQKLREGEPLGGTRAKAADEFEAVGGGTSSGSGDIFG